MLMKISEDFKEETNNSLTEIQENTIKQIKAFKDREETQSNR